MDPPPAATTSGINEFAKLANIIHPSAGRFPPLRSTTLAPFNGSHSTDTGLYQHDQIVAV